MLWMFAWLRTKKERETLFLFPFSDILLLSKRKKEQSFDFWFRNELFFAKENRNGMPLRYIPQVFFDVGWFEEKAISIFFFQGTEV